MNTQEKWQEIANRGLQDRFTPEKRAKFDEAVRRGLIKLPGGPDRAGLEAQLQSAHASGDAKGVIAAQQALKQLDDTAAVGAASGEGVPEDPSLASNVARGAAKGVAGTLAFPAEAMLAIPKAGAYLAGDQESLDYLSTIDPTGAINKILNAAGVRTDPEPGNFEERMAANTAEAVAGGAVGLGAAGLARGVVPQFMGGNPGAQRLMQGRLGSFMAEDAAAATVGAGGKSIAEEMNLGDPAEHGTEFALNFFTGGLLDKARFAAEGFQAAKGLSARERQSAANFVQAPIRMVNEDPAQIAATLRAGGPPGTELLTTGARSASPALQMLENSLITSNPDLAARYVNSKKTLDQYVKDEMKTALGGDGVSQDFIDNYRKGADWALQVTEKNRQAVVEQMHKELADMPPDLDYSQVIKSKMTEMKRIDRDIEKDLWSQTGAEDLVTQSADPGRPFLKEAHDSLMGELAEAGRFEQHVTMPDRLLMADIKEVAESGTATVGEMLALRSAVLDAAAEASSKNNDGLARRLNKIAEGALNTLDGASGPNAEAIRQARQFSRDLNDRYSRDVISPLLAQSANRGEKVAGNETMERIFKSGEKGRTNMKALNLAMGGVPSEAKSYILRQFYAKIGDDGTNVAGAESFIANHRPALEEAGLMDTVSAYVRTGRAVNKANTELAQMTNPNNMDVTAKLLKTYGTTGNDLVNFLGETLKSTSRSSQSKLTEMYQSALTDLSGKALHGLQNATVEGALKAMHTQAGDVPSAGIEGINTRIMNALSATGQFTPEQVERVGQLGTLLQKQYQSERVKAVKGISNTPGDLAGASFLGALFKYAGLTKIAPLVKSEGPGSLAAAGMVGRIMQGVAGKITKNEAISLIKASVFDGEIMAALQEAPAVMSPQAKSVIGSFLRGTRRVFAAGNVESSQTTIVPELIESMGSEQEAENGR